MRIRDLYTDNTTIIPVGNNYYNSREWFLQTYNLLDGLIRRTQGNRILYEDLETLDDVKAAVDDLLVFNRYKYDHLWKLYVAEYNPLWNVDGTEKTIRERVNTGTQENALSGKDSLEYLGSEKDSHTGHDDVTKSGSEVRARTGHDDVTQTGSITDSNSGNITSSRTTFDSSTFADTDKDTDSRSTTKTFNSKKDQTNYNSTDTTSFTARKDETAYSSDMTHSFTGRKDETTFGKKDTRTDNLTEHEEITHIRGGNIGVTMTTQLETDEVNFVNSFHFLQTIVSDIANHISYIW